jgi:hypothetical protein
MLSRLKSPPFLACLFVAGAFLAAPAMAHGHGQHSGGCLFGMEKVQVRIDDLADGVRVTLTSDDEEVVDTLQDRAWEQVDPQAGGREHDCFFHREGFGVLLDEVHDGVILTITSSDEETVAELQEMARRVAKKGCRHGSHHESQR